MITWLDTLTKLIESNRQLNKIDPDETYYLADEYDRVKRLEVRFIKEFAFVFGLAQPEGKDDLAT